jgi:cytochrome b involved in lipid metabolism
MLSSIMSLFSSKPPLTVFEDYESIVELGKKKNRVFVTINDEVYDLTDYKNHPGGCKVLELCKGKDATEVFKKYHWPEGDSRTLMKKYKIGRLDLSLGLSKEKEAQPNNDSENNLSIIRS